VRLEVLANALEEPFVRIYFAVIAMLDTEHKIDAEAMQNCVFDAEIPGCALKAMQNIVWNFVVRNVFMH
jgi:hypothetical protein